MHLLNSLICSLSELRSCVKVEVAVLGSLSLISLMVFLSVFLPACLPLCVCVCACVRACVCVCV